jgi:hypothetical protein
MERVLEKTNHSLYNLENGIGGCVDMKNSLWELIAETRQMDLYFTGYRDFSRIMNAMVSLLCGIPAIASIANWSIWGTIPLVWASITALASAVQLIRPHLPFSRQIVGLNFLCPALSKLVIDMEHEWRLLQIEENSGKRIEGLIHKFTDERDTLESKYTGGIWFPRLKRLNKRAEFERNLYMEKLRREFDEQ